MRRWIVNRSLGTKFALMIVGILIVTMSALGYLYLHAQYEQAASRLSSKGQALGRFVSLISPSFVLSYDFEGMNDFMREISREPDVIYGVLVAQNNVSLTRYLNESNPYVREAMQLRGSDNVVEVVEQINRSADVMKLDFPVLFDNEVIGRLILGLDRKPLNEGFRRSLVELLVALGALVAFLTIALYVGFQVMALRPILALRQGLQRVAGGDLSGAIPVPANDEIGGLTRSFNDMVDRLRRTISEKDEIAHQLLDQASELSRLNQNLEGRVQESARIMRDLHDDVGARLLTLSHRCIDTSNAETARSALQYLRETIRGLDRKGVTVQLADALADWEAEAADRLDAAGITLDWQQQTALPAMRLSNRQHINLGRIVREAISNAIRHGSPKEIEATTDVRDGMLSLRLCDDGDGGDPEVWERGTGLNNMATRAAELGGTVRWRERAATGNAAGRGICVEISCPLKQGD